jgi:copper(I)-binding protein
MNTSFKTLASQLLCLPALAIGFAASADVALVRPVAGAASAYQAVLRVDHRCDGSPTKVCEQGRAEWSQLPATGTSTQGLKTPAVLLQVQASAPVKVEQGWVRPSVPGQQGTGGYMKLTAREGQRLVGASSPAAGVAEIHEMKMDGEVMTMRPAGAIDLPAGKTVEFKPGGLHLMLMDLKQPLAAGSSVPVTLVFKNGRGVESRVEAQLLVSQSAPGAAAAADPHRH